MTNSKVAARYATSFLETALEKNILDRVSDDFEYVESVIRKNKELERAILSPVIKTELKQKVLKEIFAEQISNESLKFLDFIILKGREDSLLHVLVKFLELRDEHLGIAKVNVTVAFDFLDEQKEQIKTQFENYLNKKVKLYFQKDPNLIGGFIARVGDTIYDASILNQLGQLKKQFTHDSYTLN